MTPDGVDHHGMKDSLDAFLDDLRAAAADVPAPEAGASLRTLFRDGTVPMPAPAAPRRHSRGLRIAIAGAVAGVTFGGLGAAGALPASLQEKMADVADVVGIRLPHSEPVLLEETEDAVTTTTSTTSTTPSTTSTTPGAPAAPGGSPAAPGAGGSSVPAPPSSAPAGTTPPGTTPPVTAAPGKDGTPPVKDEGKPGNSGNAPGQAEDRDDEADDDEKVKDKDKDRSTTTTTTTTTTQAPRAERGEQRRPLVPFAGVSREERSSLTTPTPTDVEQDED